MNIFTRLSYINKQYGFGKRFGSALNEFIKIIKSKWSQFDHVNQRTRSLCLVTSSFGMFSSWEDIRISNDDMQREVNDMLSLFNCSDLTSADMGKYTSANIDLEKMRKLSDKDWLKIYDKRDLIIWRKKVNLDVKDAGGDIEVYEYKVLGRIEDLTPLEFYQTQLDLEYRKVWDNLVISLDVVAKDTLSGTELIYWTMRYPYPLYPREYILTRRHQIDLIDNLLILVTRSVSNRYLSGRLASGSGSSNQLVSTQQQQKQQQQEQQQQQQQQLQQVNNSSAQQFVRVDEFKSNLVIVPKVAMDKPGLIYIMQYYDVNKAKIPKFAYTWMAASGLPNYIEKLHKATVHLKLQNSPSSKVH